MMRIRTVAVGLLLVGAAAAQDVFVGGRVDLELLVDQEVTVDFGRDAGIDLTFQQPGVLDAYFDVTIAGGDVRVQEFYLQLPQTREVVDVTVGRFLLPHGGSRTNVIDRYVAGGPDLHDAYDAFRRGNVLLDVDLTGVRVSRSGEHYAVDLFGGVPADEGELGGGLRLVGRTAGFEGGGSVFFGRDTLGAALTQGVLHAGFEAGPVEGLGQLYVGRASGGDHRGWSGRLRYRPVPAVDLFLAQTMYNDDRIRAVTTSRFGVRYRFDRNYRAELRFEVNDAPPPAGDDLLVARLTAVF